MIHRVYGKKLGRSTNQRKGLFRNLANSLIIHEKIVTTEAKAKAVRPMVEKLITRAKEDTLHNRRLLIKELTKENSVKKMLEVIGPKFKERPGGYTRLVKLGARFGDKAPMVSITFTEDVSLVEIQKEKPKKLKVTDIKEEDKKEVKPGKKLAKEPRAKKESNGTKK